HRGGYEAGRVGAADYFAARLKRLGELARPGMGAEQSSALILHHLAEKGEMWERGPFEHKELARARFEASQAKASDLVVARLEAARGALEARRREFLDGRSIIDPLLESVARVAIAEAAVDGSPTRRLALREGLW